MQPQPHAPTSVYQQQQQQPTQPQPLREQVNEKCLASLFQFGPVKYSFDGSVRYWKLGDRVLANEADEDSEIAYELLAEFLSYPEVAESLKGAPLLVSNFFDALCYIREYNARHLEHYIADCQADRQGLIGAEAEAIAYQERAQGKPEACADPAGHAASIKEINTAGYINKKEILHYKSDCALAHVLKVLKEKCGHDGHVRHADIQLWTKARQAQAQSQPQTPTSAGM